MGITLKEFQEIMQGNPEIAIVGDDRPVAPRTPHIVTVTDITPTEHEEQVTLFQWAAANSIAHPELHALFAVPNGGHRHVAVAAMLKQEGVKAGVPDICLPVARGKFHALYIELKRSDRSNHPTDEQFEWLNRLRYFGNSAIVAYGADQAIQAIMAYLGQEG